MRILCLGYSFTGRYLANNFDHDVYFLSRDPEKVTASGHKTIDSSVAYDLILDCVPRFLESNPNKTIYGNDLKDGNIQFQVYVHISSTSVFGSRDTQFTDPNPVYNELSETNPDDDRGRNRWRLEQAVCNDFPEALIVRAGGIYGESRCLPESIRAKRYIPDSNQLVSRIHVHDLIRICLEGAMAIKRNPDIRFAGYERNRLICGVDGHTTTNAELLAFIESEFQIETPLSQIKNMPVIGRGIESLYAKDLIQEFNYRDYKEGFKDCVGKLQ